MIPVEQSLVRAAARNNAELCAAVCRSHGLTGEFGQHAWTVSVRTPVYYPDAVTLVPGADTAALLARIDTTTPGASVKDSFSDLDLTAAGFQVLFEAQWIHRPASAPAPQSDLAWTVVGSADTLRTWALARDGGGDAQLFRPELLSDPATCVLGISNVFTSHGGADAAWPMVLGAVHRLYPTLPVVGYEHGEYLDAALRHGFASGSSTRERVRPDGRQVGNRSLPAIFRRQSNQAGKDIRAPECFSFVRLLV